METVDPPDMPLQLREGGEQTPVWGTERAAVCQQLPVLTLQFCALEADPIFSVRQQNLVLHLTENCPAPGGDNLLEVSPAQSALVPETEDSHPGGAGQADGVVTLPHSQHQQRAQTQLAVLGLGGHLGYYVRVY